MPATAKRGFRLPWMRDDAGSEAVGTQVLDGRPGDAASADTDPATDPEVEALDDLGSGPSGIAPPPPPREIAATSDSGGVLDLEQRTPPDPSRDEPMDGDSGGDLPKWLRQGPSGSSDTAPQAEPEGAEDRPGINVVSSVEPAPSNGVVPHAVAPASAWPQADFAARVAAAPSAAQTEPAPDGAPASLPSDHPATADPGLASVRAEAPLP